MIFITTTAIVEGSPVRKYVGVKVYPQLFEWFFVLGTEVYAQSNARWACRIKKPHSDIEHA